MKAALVAGLVGGLVASSAMAAVTTVARYSFDNSNLTEGLDTGIGHDSVGGWHLKDGPSSVSWSNDAAPNGGAGSVVFNGTSSYLSTWDVPDNPLNGRTQNYGVELWVKASSEASSELVVFAFNPDQSGMLQILQTSDGDVQGFVGAIAGRAYVGNGANIVNEWVHLAAVVFDADVFFYVNGEHVGTTSQLPEPVQSAFTLGQKPGGGKPFAGQIDELRLFTFNSGEFQVSDLSYYVPEPASLGMIGMAGLALLGRRRSRA